MSRIDNLVAYDREQPLSAAVDNKVSSAVWEGALHIEGGIARPTSGLGRSISSILVLKRGLGCQSSGVFSSYGGGGAGFLASFSTEWYYDSEGNLVNGIGEITILNPGAGYSTIPDIALVSNGTGCVNYRLQAILSALSTARTTFYLESDGYTPCLGRL